MEKGLGDYVKKHESGKKGTFAIGRDKNGGYSYGTYQIASRPGTMKDFVRYLKNRKPEAYKALSAAGDPNKKGEFQETWLRLAKDKIITPEDEYDFIYRTHYTPALNTLTPELKSLVESNRGLREVVWSTSVQHGARGGPARMNAAFAATKGQPIAAFLTKLYLDERAKDFGSSTAEVQEAIAKKRFPRELAEMQTLVASYSKNNGDKEKVPAPKAGPSQNVDYPDLTGRPFKEAFEEAREELKSPMFRWKGKLYTTQRADEVASKIKAAVTKEPSLPAKDGGVEDIFGGEIESPAKRASRLEREKAPEDAFGDFALGEVNRMPSEELGYSPVKKKKSDILQETIGSKYDKMGFGEAFAKARKKGEKEFSWRGKPYTTKYKEEI